MKDVGKFYVHFVHFTVICNILRSFWYIFYRFDVVFYEKSGNRVANVSFLSFSAVCGALFSFDNM
jgi:hypothetical protein